MRIYLILATLVLSACGGTVEDTGGAGPTGSAELIAFEALSGDVLLEGYTGTPALSSTATYNGFANMIKGVDSTTSYIGDLEMTVDFSSVGGAVSGTIDDFQSYTSGADPASAVMTDETGSIALTGTYTGSNDFLSPAISGTATGTLDDASGTVTMSGHIYGTAAEYVQLTLWGTPDTFGGLAIAQQE